MDFQSDANPAQTFDEHTAWIFCPTLTPAQTCREIAAPQLDRARNVQFRHFPIDSESGISALSHRALSPIRAASTITP